MLLAADAFAPLLALILANSRLLESGGMLKCWANAESV